MIQKKNDTVNHEPASYETYMKLCVIATKRLC